MINNNEIAAAIRELSQALSPHETAWYESLGFWSLVVPAAIGIITFVLTQHSARQKFRHDMSMTCISKYTKLFDKVKTVNVTNVNDYLSIINEQMFYFRKGLVYKEFINEWLRNMIYTLPVYYRGKGDKPVLFNGELLAATGSFFANKANMHLLFPYLNIRLTICLDAKYCAKPLVVTDDVEKAYAQLESNSEALNLLVKGMRKNLRAIALNEWKSFFFINYLPWANKLLL